VGPAPLAVVGAVLAVAGGFLPWLDALGGSLTAWHLPVQRLVSSTFSGVAVGPLLLVTVVVLLPLVTRRPLPMVVSILAGAVATNSAGMALVLALRSGPGVSPGIGIVVTIVGGLLVIFGSVRVWPVARRAA
jgi:hypothetical protein